MRFSAGLIARAGGTSLVVALDAPITTTLASSTQLAFGFDRLVQGFAGNTVRLQRSSDTTQADFGFDASTGIFNLAAAVAWAAGSSATVVRFYDQNGTGKTLDANTATIIAFISGGAATRFGTSWSNVDGQLTQSTINGGVGCSVAGGGYFTLASSGISLTSGVEFHSLIAPLSRKKATATVDPTEFGATNTSEGVFSYGTSATNYVRYILGGATAPSLMRRLGTGAGGTDQLITVSPEPAVAIKKYGQLVHSCRLDASEFSFYAVGRKVSTAATSAGNVTANASMNNGQLRVGEGFATGTPGNMLFGGIIVTTTLSDKDRTYVQSALSAVGQQHRRKKVSDLLAYFDEIIDMRDVDGNGLVAGRNGKTSIQFNKTTGSPNFNFAYTTPQGWVGIHSPSNTNTDNTYTATNNYFTDVQSGSVMTVCVNENVTINQTWQLRSDSDNSNFSLGMGRHHSTPDFYHCSSAAIDTQGWTHHLYSADGNDAGGGQLSQSMCKYQFNLTHGDWTPGKTTSADIVSVLYGVTIPSGSVLDTAAAATVGWNYPLPEELYASEVDVKFAATVGELLYHAATFQKGPSYNPSDPEATRRLYMRTGTNCSYVGHPGSPVGHRDGSIASENGTGSIVASDSNFHIQSGNYQGDVNMGTHLFWMFSKSVWTQAQIEEIQTNLYKLIYSGYA